MPNLSLDQAARTVLDQHDRSRFGNARLNFLGNAGGFSGARLWRADGGDASYCLRAWPPSYSAERLNSIHQRMIAARRAGLCFVPAVFPTMSKATWVEHVGRLWDLTSWQPGRADFHDRPSTARLEAACKALAQLHVAWAPLVPAHGPCPAIERRLVLLRDWIGLVESGWRPTFRSGVSTSLQLWAQRAYHILPEHLRRLPGQLARWKDVPLPLQPCLCDIWHDHVLFEGDVVTGIIDFGSIKQDHVAVDLARLLGSIVADDRELRAAGLEAYAPRRPLTEDESNLVDVLDRTGTVLAAANWLKWLFKDGKQFADLEGVAKRLEGVARRMESWLTPIR